MEIKFKNAENIISSELVARVEDRLQKFSKLLPDEGNGARAEFELRRNSSDHNSQKKWEALLNVDVTGNRFNSGATGETEELAADQAIEEMKDVLLKKANKERSIERRKGSFWKMFSRKQD